MAVAFAAVYFCWGSTYLAIRFAIETMPPFLMAGIRFLLAGALVYSWERLRGAEREEPRHWKTAAAVGGLLLLGGNGAVVHAQQTIPSGITALILGVSPFWMVLLSWLFFSGKRPSGRVMIGLLIGFTGIGLLIGPNRLSEGGMSVDPTGAAILIFATLCWTAGSLYSRGAPVPRSMMLFTGMQMLAGGALLTLAGLATGETARFHPGAFSTESMFGFAYLVVFGSLIGFSAYVYVLRHASVAAASTYAYVNPVVAVFLGWLIADEPMSGRTLVAAAIIISAVVMISSPGKKSPPALTPME